MVENNVWDESFLLLDSVLVEGVDCNLELALELIFFLDYLNDEEEHLPTRNRFNPDDAN